MTRSSKIAGWSTTLFVAALATIGFGQPARPDAKAKQDPPVVLPQVDVYANVPLVKVADYRMREDRYQPAAVAQGDYIYIIGGSTSQNSILDSVERFNVRTGKSEAFATLALGRRGHRAVLVDNRIYVLGGYSVQSIISDSVVIAQAMTMQGTAPGKSPFDVTVSPRHSHTNEAANNPNIPPDPEMMDYAKRDLRRLAHGSGSFGVIENTGLEQSVEVINLATRKVSHATELPEPRAQFACVARGGKIYVIGGQRLYRHVTLARTNTVKIFDPATSKWTDGVSMPTPRESEGVLTDGRLIVVPGGFDGREVRAEVQVFNPEDNLWRLLPPLCRPTSANSLVFLDHYLFLFGDFDAPGEWLAYDLVTKQSETFKVEYEPARHGAAVVHEGKIYVIGGRASSVADPVSTIQVFALRKKT